MRIEQSEPAIEAPPAPVEPPPADIPNAIPFDVAIELYDAETWLYPERQAAFDEAFRDHLTRTTDRTAAAWRAIVTCRKLFGDWTPRNTEAAT